MGEAKSIPFSSPWARCFQQVGQDGDRQETSSSRKASLHGPKWLSVVRRVFPAPSLPTASIASGMLFATNINLIQSSSSFRNLMYSAIGGTTHLHASPARTPVALVTPRRPTQGGFFWVSSHLLTLTTVRTSEGANGRRALDLGWRICVSCYACCYVRELLKNPSQLCSRSKQAHFRWFDD